jgi:hypothetical protein
MAETIYTIPVNESFSAAPEHNPAECPFCLMKKALNNNEIERILGAAMMEPDVRIETNKLGFCKNHLNEMASKDKKLPFALILESHLAEKKKEIFDSSKLFDSQGNKQEKKLSSLRESCYVCTRIEYSFSKMVSNMFWLWETDDEFKVKFQNQKYFCLPHYEMIIKSGREQLNKKSFSEFYKQAETIEKKYIEELGNDVSWFCKKFDYRYDSEPWYNAKDSVSRSVTFLSGGINDKSKDFKI